MYEIVTISPELSLTPYFSCPKRYEVIFQSERMVLDHYVQRSTVCIIRDGLNVVGLGYTIQNPSDYDDIDLANQYAFRRAVESFYTGYSYLYNISFGSEFLRQEKKAWRTALRNARMKRDEEMK